MTEKANLKSDDKMQVEEAFYLMEASFNYFHCFSNLNYDELIQDSIVEPLNLNGEESISMNYLQELYKKVNNNMYNAFQQKNISNKHIKYVDVEYFNDSLKVYYFIGQSDDRKSVKTNNQISELGFSWQNSTPYNSQSSKTWSLIVNSTGSTELDRILESDIHLPVTSLGFSEYFSDLWNTGYQTVCRGYDPIWGTIESVDYEEMFSSNCPPILVSQINSNITKPTEEPSFWPYYYGHRSVEASTWIKDQGLGINASYKQMNKYYNCVYTWIDFYKYYRMSSTSCSNYYREPISFDLKINNYISSVNN
jgi:hypothetical protein